MNDRYMGGYQAIPGTQAVPVLGGFVGQIVFADEVIWQSGVEEDREDAHTLALVNLKKKMKELFQ